MSSYLVSCVYTLITETLVYLELFGNAVAFNGFWCLRQKDRRRRTLCFWMKFICSRDMRTSYPYWSTFDLLSSLVMLMIGKTETYLRAAAIRFLSQPINTNVVYKAVRKSLSQCV